MSFRRILDRIWLWTIGLAAAVLIPVWLIGYATDHFRAGLAVVFVLLIAYGIYDALTEAPSEESSTPEQK